ncbi:ubiquitin carboxyl-terminal hydrolase 19-like [Palaemon carinicauda]|uniref:ubiquitin carboxyl-terminal hydrolase 19-like n=1 Tax=Palaemon carinicauda TaxID=392227 RepID=UPI0035B5F4C3
MEPSNKQKQDVGTSAKKKKDRENRNSISNDLVYDWNQKNEFVTVSVLVGLGHDNRTVSVHTEATRLTVSLSDGRKFSTRLYESVVPEGTSISFKGPKCSIKLLKNDPQIHWLQLEPCKKLTPEKIFPTKNKASSPGKTAEKKNSETEEKEDTSIIPVTNVKSDLVERDAEKIIVLVLYIKNVNKETASVNFQEDSVIVHFSSSDSRFLQQYPGSTEESVFEWKTSLKEKVELDECKYKIVPAKIEIKLKKKNVKKWGSVVPATPENALSTKVAKNTWISAGKSETPNLGTIPPAPPAPPTPTEKKPMCLVSPVSKGMRGGPSSSFSSSSSVCDVGGNVVPRGTTGLDNIGNTCFMNSVLQCLINTIELREYFLDFSFQQDINKDNPLGMGGKLASSFAFLMKLLWSGTFRSHAPTKLKSVMSMKANQFSGFAQHDAQEFMVELLDGLHEDLNRVRKKPYIAEPPDLDGWPDDQAADESWKLHKMRNDSIIDDLFKGQFKSTLTCHQCNKISVKFDEFCCLSVPIPKDQKVIQVIFFWKDPNQKPKKYYIRFAANASVEELKFELCERTGVQASCIQVFEMFKSKIHKIFNKGASLASVVPTDALMAYEVYNEAQVGEPVIEIAVVQRMMIPNPPTRCAHCSRNAAPGSKLRRCTKCFRAGYCHQTCQRNHWNSHKIHCKLVPEPVGCPFIVSLPESHATYSRLTRIMEGYARYSVDIFQPPVFHDTSHRGSTSSIELSGEENDEMEVEDGENLNRGENGDILMDGESSQTDSQDHWGDDAAGGSCEGAVGGDSGGGSSDGGGSDGGGGGSGSDEPPQLSSSPNVRAVPPRGSLQLPSATQLFVLRPVNVQAQNLSAPNGEPLEDKGEEPLDLSDKYYIAMDWRTNERLPGYCLVQNKEVDCEVEGSCTLQRNQQTTLEACIELFTQPENLSEGDSWRCPRCKKPVEATKQMSIWRLPHVLIIQLKRFSFKYVLYSDKIDKIVQYPVRGLNVQPYMSRKPEDGPAIYDLYGVINHMGRLLGGHYTAYARTVAKHDTRQSEIDWRLFDDSRVSLCQESRVVNEQAYLLLYRRRETPFVINRQLPLPAPVLEDGSSEQTAENEESCPMSVSSTSQLSSSQPSTSSLEGEEHLSTTQEELD